jgi:hypothetical protein
MPRSNSTLVMSLGQVSKNGAMARQNAVPGWAGFRICNVDWQELRLIEPRKNWVGERSVAARQILRPAGAGLGMTSKF